MTKTQQVLKAVHRELMKKQPYLDQEPELRSVMLDVKFRTESQTVRCVVVQVETESHVG